MGRKKLTAAIEAATGMKVRYRDAGHKRVDAWLYLGDEALFPCGGYYDTKREALHALLRSLKLKSIKVVEGQDPAAVLCCEVNLDAELLSCGSRRVVCSDPQAVARKILLI